MKKPFFILLSLMLSISVMAQQKIQLRSVDKAECVKSDMTSLKASFSFSTIEAQDYESERGTFSWLSLPNTIIGGNEGDPQIPVVNELIAVPFGASPRIEITSFSSTDYRLEDYGIRTLVPRQPSLRKDKTSKEVPFVYNEAAYQSTRGFRSTPMATVNVVGTMRGVQLGKMAIEPVSYDPVSNTLRVFNNIEVEVYFDGADARATEDMLVNTYSPYFDIVYKQLFNNRAVFDVYTDHPDLYTTPVRMLVVTTETYANSAAFQSWLTWKKQKGIYVDVQTVDNNASAATIKNLIYSRYNANHPTFLVIVGDETVVTHYALWNYNSIYGNAATDLEYASVDGDVYHDMFISRMPVSSTTELSNLVNKTLTYEQYTMADPSYLNNVLLIAGADNTWAPRVGRPTINYAADNYFNTEHGFNNIYKYVTNDYAGCYNYLNTGVGFANYTAHGDIQEWSSPNFTNNNVNNLTNNDKYFWAMGNCCLTCNFKNVQNNQTCFGETMVRAANKGAFGYIGSVPESYWFEDFYFGVGAFAAQQGTNNPTLAGTTTGCYDAMFDDTGFNTLNSVPFIGNVAVSYAHAANYNGSVSDEYYWRAYQCFGDGSVMPYLNQPAANNVSHAQTLGIGMNSFTVNADEGSYVAITKDNEILGVAQVGSTGSVDVPITPITTTGDVMIVVTRNQRQPYITTIPAVSLDGPYIIVDSYAPTFAHVGDEASLDITFKNVGPEATTGNTYITLSSENDELTLIQSGNQFGALAADASITLSGFAYRIAQGVADGTRFTINVLAVSGSETWESKIFITAGEAILTYDNMSWAGSFVPGETVSVMAYFKNVGHYMATNAIATIASSSQYVSFPDNAIEVGTIDPNGYAMCTFNVTFAANCPETEQIPVTFTLNADGGLTAQGTATLSNSCNVIFDLGDSYGDGWSDAYLTVAFNDGTPSQNLTVSGSTGSYTYNINNGVQVTLSWHPSSSFGGYWDSECSIHVYYEGGDDIFSVTGPSSGTLHTFVCACGGSASVEVFDPVENLNATVNGSDVTLTWDQPTEGTPINYVIYRNGIEIGGANQTTYTDQVIEWGSYTYCVVAIYATGLSTPACVQVDYFDAVNEIEVEFAIYPNPANSTLFVNGGDAEYSYEMFNGMGQKVAEGKATGNTQISVSSLTKGVYFLRLTSGTQMRMEKVVVE